MDMAKAVDFIKSLTEDDLVKIRKDPVARQQFMRFMQKVQNHLPQYIQHCKRKEAFASVGIDVGEYHG